MCQKGRHQIHVKIDCLKLSGALNYKVQKVQLKKFINLLPFLVKLELIWNSVVVPREILEQNSLTRGLCRRRLDEQMNILQTCICFFQ